MSDIREALEAAYESSTSTEAPAAPAEAVAEMPASVEAVQTETAAPAGETAEAKAQRIRDEKGRFAPKSATPAPKAAEATATPAPQTATPTPTEAPKPATPSATDLRAPQSWRPEMREKWNALPEEVRREVLRRERETQTALQETTEARKFREQFEATINPYRALMTGQPLEVVRNLMQTAAQLQTAPPAHKAQLVAQLVKTYGIPVEALDAALAGEGTPHPQQPPVYRDPRLDMLLQQAQRQRQQAAVQELSGFAQKAEFIEDVRSDMADLIEMAARRGSKMSLEDAYNRACLLHPEVSKVMEQRKAAQAAATATAATQQARAAASSVQSRPTMSVGDSKPKDLRGTIEASIEALAGR